MDCSIQNEATHCPEDKGLQYSKVLQNVQVKQEIFEEDSDFFVRQYFSQVKREFGEPFTSKLTFCSSTYNTILEQDLNNNLESTTSTSHHNVHADSCDKKVQDYKNNVMPPHSFACEECEKSFSSLSSLRKHAHVHKRRNKLNSTHPKTQQLSHYSPKKGQIRQRRNNSANTKEKVMTNMDSVPEVKEEIEEPAATEQKDYKLHVQVLVSSPESDAFQCNVCNKILATKAAYQRHNYIQHSGVSHSCPVCGKSFRQKGNLSKHIRVHTGEKPFRCQFCERTFSQKWSKVHHERTHTGEKPYQCEVCHKRFIQLGHLKTHQQAVHEKIKSHMCPICATTFAHSCSYKAHMRSHTGERPYKCKYCEKSFTHLITVNDHEMSHLRKLGQNTS